MNWFDLVNRATLYIEEHITEDLQLEDIANQCHVSYSYFTKTFTMITGHSLKEYIRNRRMTLASYEVSNTNKRILDIAMKYRYSSNETFSRAFKTIHGINPSTARKSDVMVYTHFPMLHYDMVKQKMVALQYEILHDLTYDFIGTSKDMSEDMSRYKEVQGEQQRYFDNFQEHYGKSRTTYRVLHHLSLRDEYWSYTFFVGYERSTYKENTDLNNLHIYAPKAVRFISPGASKDQIPEIKKVIYDEWEKNGFLDAFICEIEYTKERPDGKIDFYYIVSIK